MYCILYIYIYTGYIGREGLCQLCGPLGNKDWPDPHYGLSPSLYAGARAARLDLYVDNPETVISIHSKKRVREFPVPSRDVTTKLSLGGNNDIITELFLPRGSLVSDIPAGDGKLVNLFLRCSDIFSVSELCWLPRGFLSIPGSNQASTSLLN